MQVLSTKIVNEEEIAEEIVGDVVTVKGTPFFIRTELIQRLIFAGQYNTIFENPRLELSIVEHKGFLAKWEIINLTI